MSRVDGYATRGMSPAERLAYYSQRDPETGCLIWTGTLNAAGYGVLTIAGKQHRAHRLAWEVANGPVPEGLVLDHLCRNRACIEIRHLEPVSDRENLDRGETCQAVARQRGTCVNGHAWDGTEAPIKDGRYQRQVCRRCAADRNARWRARKRAA